MHLGVFLGSQHGKTPNFAEIAKFVGRAIASRNIALVYGGGSVGLMGELSNAVIDLGGDVIGVITHWLEEHEVGNDRVKELIKVETLEERKRIMFKRSDGFLILPGGVGTLDELFSVMSWNILHYHSKPVGVLNVDGYYNPLIKLLEHQCEEGFIPKVWVEQLLISDNVEELLDLIEINI